jgi:hypothetical protein
MEPAPPVATPDDRARLAELARQIAQMEPVTPGCTRTQAIRAAVEYTLEYAFGIGEGEDRVNAS